MIPTLKDWFESVEYKITEGSDYHWDSFGPNAYSLDSWNGGHFYDERIFTVVFDKKTQFVYEMQAWINGQQFRWISPDFVEAYKQECIEKEVEFEESIDDYKFIEVTPEKIFSFKEKELDTQMSLF
jgi:hypothetical protein